MQFHPDEEMLYPEHLLAMAKDLEHFGRMNDPTASTWIKGPCGDEMEFYLTIKDGIIEDAKFYAEGCIATRLCGSKTASLAIDKNIYDALCISPRSVMDLLDGLPQNHRHCAILAVSTLHKTIAEYLLTK